MYFITRMQESCQSKGKTMPKTGKQQPLTSAAFCFVFVQR